MIVKKFAVWFSTECCAGHQVVLFIFADSFLLVFFQVADASYLLIIQKQAARNETLWKLTEHLWNTSACAAYAIQLHCQYSLEISDEITMKTAITICVSHFKGHYCGWSCGVDYHVYTTTKAARLLQNSVCNSSIKRSEYLKLCMLGTLSIHHQLLIRYKLCWVWSDVVDKLEVFYWAGRFNPFKECALVDLQWLPRAGVR